MPLTPPPSIGKAGTVHRCDSPSSVAVLAWHPCMMTDRTRPPPSPNPVTTSVLWDSVVGARLEELLHGLLEALGADELAWRAGSHAGVNAADGGRDLEAAFSRATPDGELDRTRWWIEAKGRTGTVPKEEVVAGVMSAAGRPDLDVFVFCTNSRFSNPTRDWVTEWQRHHPRPKIRLWDRDRLARLVREHPTVAARVLPEALDDAQRLDLLLERFRRLGETATEDDLVYYWQRPEVIIASENCVSAVAMFAYAENSDGLVNRPWAVLLPNDPETSAVAIIEAIVRLPFLLIRPLPRPLHNKRLIETAAYLILTVLTRLSASALHELLCNPAAFLEDEGWDTLGDPDGARTWREAVSIPLLARVQSELEDVCTDDCVRVSSEPHAFPQSMLGKRYWRRFGIGELADDSRLIIEQPSRPCAVGLPLDRNHGCPLIREPELSVTRIAELQQVVEFRREHPDGQFLRLVRRQQGD